MSTILLAGATGYLGRHIGYELIQRGLPARLLVRNPDKVVHLNTHNLDVVQAEITQPETLQGVLESVDTVISTVGITRQKDGLTYMDVDYQANKNLLDEAKKQGVRRFIYVSVLNGEHMRHLQICEAKERFVDALKASGLEYTVVRPNGFFSDLATFVDMAKRGRVYLFGDGSVKANPIHGADLAKVCIDAITQSSQEIIVGGPEVLTQLEIAKLAFAAVGKRPQITHIPDGVRRSLLALARTFMRPQAYGPLEFFMTAMAMDMIAPTTGHRTLGAFYKEVAQLYGVSITHQPLYQTQPAHK